MPSADALGQDGEVEDLLAKRLGGLFTAGQPHLERGCGDRRVADRLGLRGEIGCQAAHRVAVVGGLRVLKRIDPLTEFDHELADGIVEIGVVAPRRVDRLLHAARIGRMAVELYRFVVLPDQHPREGAAACVAVGSGATGQHQLLGGEQQDPVLGREEVVRDQLADQVAQGK